MKENEKESLTLVQERVAALQGKKQQEVLRAGELIGMTKTNRFHAEFIRYSQLASQIRALEEGTHEAYGMDAKKFCKEILGIPYTTLNEQRTLLKNTKLEVVSAFKALGYSDGQISILKTSEEEELKALINKGTLTIGKEEIPVTPDNMPKIAKHIERIVNQNKELEAEKEELGKKLLSKYDMADRNKKLEEKNKQLEQEKNVLTQKYENARHGLSEDDIRSLNAIQNHKDQFDAIITLMETADVKAYSSKVRADFVGFAEYMHDRICLMFDLVKNTQDAFDPVPDAQLDEDREWFTKKYGKEAL